MSNNRIIKTMHEADVEIVVGDITVVAADAIVNAANSSLLGGGGVDGAIHRAAGPELLAECRKIRVERGSLPTGQAVLTGAGRLPSRFVIHTVGPVYNPGDPQCPRLLAACYANSLKLAGDAGCDSIAIPAVSTGVYGYPKAEAATIAWAEVKMHLSSGGRPRKLLLVFYAEPDARIFLHAVGEE